MSRRLSTDPADRMGIYKRLDDVPDRYRLRHHSAAYAGRDVWAEYLDQHLTKAYPDATERFYRTAEYAGEQWKDHMADRGRHHALARPDDVGAWVVDLLADRNVRTVYSQYWIRLEDFYTWLQNHAEHPHVYHPVLMAVETSDAARRVWDTKMAQRSSNGGATT